MLFLLQFQNTLQKKKMNALLIDFKPILSGIPRGRPLQYRTSKESLTTPCCPAAPSRLTRIYHFDNFTESQWDTYISENIIRSKLFWRWRRRKKCCYQTFFFLPEMQEKQIQMHTCLVIITIIIQKRLAKFLEANTKLVHTSNAI